MSFGREKYDFQTRLWHNNSVHNPLFPRLGWVPGLSAMQQRPRADIRGVVVHRIEVSQEDASYADTAPEIARFFAEHPIGVAATGGAMPYPLIIDAYGEVTQTVPLRYVTPHARRYNASTVGVACLGDFRTQPPLPLQRAALLCICAALVEIFGLTAKDLHGHDELYGASHDANKECPGHLLPLAALRKDVRDKIEGSSPRGTEPSFRLPSSLSLQAGLVW